MQRVRGPALPSFLRIGAAPGGRSLGGLGGGGEGPRGLARQLCQDWVSLGPLQDTLCSRGTGVAPERHMALAKTFLWPSVWGPV